MVFSGKYWFQELTDWLIGYGFYQSSVISCMFWKIFPDGSIIRLLNYVDDMLYFGTSPVSVKLFETDLSTKFDLELMNQAHWYLSCRITQDAFYNITIDQLRYCLSLVKRFLDKAGCKKVVQFHNSSLPAIFVPSSADNYTDLTQVGLLQEEYNIDYASCIGALIYLSQTCTDILFAVNKLAKYSKKPGEVHMQALIHLLRYLRDNSYLGVKFYCNITQSPVYNILLTTKNFDTSQLMFVFCDSSWNDDVDTGRSTGCYLIYYMGGVVDHSSNMPDPIALSSAEAEYNEACLACMALSQFKML